MLVDREIFFTKSMIKSKIGKFKTFFIKTTQIEQLRE